MEIRRSTQKDLNEILAIYEHARKEMRLAGNPTQWGDSYPPIGIIEEDIRESNSYVVTEQGKICGVFMFRIGEDPTYQRIKDGDWLNKDVYGTIHRLAGNGKIKGIFDICTMYCESKAPNIRVDTHARNHKMRHLLERRGYQRCGRIYVADHSQRIAYQKVTQDCQ